ncbi:MAG: MarR family winged helix-turn-helix transcriptional regulator [Tabrizicola sp.]
MTDQSDAFDLEDFLPYLLNQAAEATSHDFQAIYRDRYGFTRTQWRVMANLGKFGAMTARDICAISHIEKTKVSRAVAALEEAAMLSRTPSETDRRAEVLSLTPNGQSVFAELGQLAIGFDQRLRKTLGAEEARALTAILKRLASRAGPTSDLDD